VPILWRAQARCGGWLLQEAVDAVAPLLGKIVLSFSE
jgi:hypothetical protein